MHFESHVKQIIQQTPYVKSFRLERPVGMECLAGQYIIVTIKSDVKELREPLTISSSPTERDYLEFTKKLTGHPFSKALEALKVGDMVLIEAPFGDFTFKDDLDKIAMIAGGVGITPLRCMIRYATDNQLKTNIILLYSNRYEDEIVFKNELEEMQRQNKNLLVVNTITRPSDKWKGLTGRINREMIEKVIPDYKKRIFFICGPPEMAKAIIEILKGMDIPESMIRYEYFPGY
jgi:ferredoxin-NADP reductase